MPKRAEGTGFGARLKLLRERAGLNQAELADRANLYKFSIAKLEQGVREPTWSTVLALAHALGVEVGEFVVADPPAQADTPPDEALRPRRAGAPSGEKAKGKGRGRRKKA